MKTPIYLDNNATTPLDPRVLEAMLPFFQGIYGNAASQTHSFGWQAAEAVKIAREQIAKSIGAGPEEIVFTSGATESDNLALKGIAETFSGQGDHIITVETEHKAVLDTCSYLERIGKRVSRLRVNSAGKIDLAALEAAFTDKTILVSIMLANNEIGLIHPMQEIAEIVHRHGAFLMSDATQAIGKIPVNVQEMGIDLMAFSAHKLYGPKGVGALYVRRRKPRVRPSPLLHGGGHERGFRSGTLNVPGIVGLGKAVELCSLNMITEGKRLATLRDHLESALLSLSGVSVNGSQKHRLPHVTNLSFAGIDPDALIMSMPGLAVATGSACTSASLEPSHVLKALGIAQEDAYASIRFSLGRFTSPAEIDAAIQQVTQAIQKLRSRR
ncbi:MAG TPA: aminotransferase class V-fold PLP-dependent enzyme [Bacteroidetes bacterium]|nr:aminotransferase class V-fold PLP-dependent enzyme [Bacteroidota bacterium]